MKKGFTLVEIIAVIAIIAVVTLAISYVLGNVYGDNTQILYETQVEAIRNAANQWAIANVFILEDTNSITLGELSKQGYITTEIIDPTTGKLFDENIEITINKDGKEYIILVNGI